MTIDVFTCDKGNDYYLCSYFNVVSLDITNNCVYFTTLQCDRQIHWLKENQFIRVH